jgi:hypothetical protein
MFPVTPATNLSPGLKLAFVLVGLMRGLNP